MQPVGPDAMDAEAQQAFHHHGANVVRVAARLRGLALAGGNRWPTPADREARAKSEAGRPLDQRLPHPADLAGAPR